MPRTHCVDCGTSVVVDPSGLCPEGHHVGAAGARIAAAFGDDRPHPDEPEPWTARVELDAEPDDEAPVPLRRARPVGVVEDVPLTGDVGPSGAGPADSAAEASPPLGDELLRELHSLSDLDGLMGGPGERSPEFGAAAPAVAPPSPAAPSTAVGPTAPDPDALAELTALEAAVQSLHMVGEPPRAEREPLGLGRPDLPRPPLPTPPPDPTPSAVIRSATADATSVPPQDRQDRVPEPAAEQSAASGRPETPPAGRGSDPIDLANFTARGRKVGREDRPKRRRFGR